MNNEGLFELLQEITGIRSYLQKKKEAKQNLANLQKDKELANEVITELTQKIENLQLSKIEFEESYKHEETIKR
jgi:chromosome segregation ATPase